MFQCNVPCTCKVYVLEAPDIRNFGVFFFIPFIKDRDIFEYIDFINVIILMSENKQIYLVFFLNAVFFLCAGETEL